MKLPAAVAAGALLVFGTLALFFKWAGEVSECIAESGVEDE